MLPEPSKEAEPVAPPDNAIVRGVTRAAALLSFLPVPPLATGSMPVTPGRGVAVSGEAAVVAARLVSIEGAADKPVPPLATGSIPVTPGAALAEPSKDAAAAAARLVWIVRGVTSLTAALALPEASKRATSHLRQFRTVCKTALIKPDAGRALDAAASVRAASVNPEGFTGVPNTPALPL
jgi:hypothetical protein